MPRRGPVRRALSLTPLVDVIFLLLLFFMLTSTFARHAEIEIGAAAAGAGAAAAGDLAFVQVGPGELRLAGRAVSPEGLAAALEGRAALVSLGEGVDAQRLIDVLGALRAVPGLSLTVLR